MMTNQPGNGPATWRAPRRSRLTIAIPVAVFALIAILIAVSAWPTIRPVRAVTVTQAVFDRPTVDDHADETSPTTRSAGPDTPARGQTVQAPGWLEAEPYYVACTALADGVVDEIHVLEGDRVARGQIVARLVAEDSELRLRQREAQLASAQSTLALAEAERRAAKRAWDEPIQQERAVETTRAALAERQAELAQLPSLIEAARATLIQREEEFKRIERIRTEGAAPRIEYIVARQQAASQRATVESLEARRPLLAASVERLKAELRAAERDLALRIEERKRLDAAQATVEQVKARLAEAKARRDEAALELERMTIRAPIDGYVQRRLKVPGDKVIRMMDSPYSAHLVHLYDPRRIQVRVDVPLADAPHVFVDQRCEVIVEVLPDRTFEGKVLRITHEADLQKNTLQVKVAVLDPSPLLRPEMLTRVKFLPASDAPEENATAGTDRVRVPSNAIKGEGESARVWIVAARKGDRGVLREVPVEPIARENDWVTVTGPLHPGTLVVIDGRKLQPGQRVQFHTATTEDAS